MNIRNDFPIFKNNPGLVFLDSTASSQKPSYVIDGIKKYLENDYSNIHRGMYSLAERSETLYEKSKKKVCEMLWGSDPREVIYTHNSNYALNLLALSLKRSAMLKKGDRVLVSIVEHHANIVPWLILKDEIGIELEYISLRDDYSLDIDDFKSKMTPNVKVVSLTHVSNVTGEVFSLEEVWKYLETLGNKKPLFVIDASQSVPHMEVDVQKIACDFLFFTGHKIFADSGVGVLWWKKEILESMQSGISGWGAISHVEKTWFIGAWIPDRFEAGTPNMTGAVSLLLALEYVDSIGWYQKLEEIEKELVQYTLSQLEATNTKLQGKNLPKIQIIWSEKVQGRVGVFSFVVQGIHSHDISEYLAERDICIRAWQHCAEPFLQSVGIHHSCRMSLHIYNTKEDIDRFFEVLMQAVEEFKNM